MNILKLEKYYWFFYERQYNYQVTAALWCCLLKFNDDVMQPANTFNEISNFLYTAWKNIGLWKTYSIRMLIFGRIYDRVSFIDINDPLS